jgi:pyruvate/2-oxoglutarate dehydrogenase complex dihydrolipoamide dehydrogenase (E3) component
MERIKADLAIIGGGSGGLAIAAGAAQLGAKVVLAEKHKMGGDCLNYGCVPSKALIAAAEAAQTIRTAARFGVNGDEPAIDFAKVQAHVHGVIAAIAPHDSVERFRSLGVTVLEAEACFVSPTELDVDGKRILARRFVVATGSSASIPPIPGIANVKVLTNETIFNLTEAPGHLIVIGGGPIGLELSQAFLRLGCKVTVIEALTILPKDDPEAVAVVRKRVMAEGLAVHEGSKVERAAAAGNGIAVTFSKSGSFETITGTHLLIAAGRHPNVNGLGLEAAGIAFSRKGIEVDRRLRTSNKRTFAVGDVAGGYQFTHIAGYHAGIVVQNALLGIPAKVNYRAVPWVTYTDPELAHVGLAHMDALKIDGTAKVVHWALAENDRAQAQRETDGFIKAVVGKRGTLLGATIVGRHAGELILPWVIAIQKRLTMRDITGLIAPYPTLSEITKRVAGAYYTPALFSDRTRAFVRLVQRLP